MPPAGDTIKIEISDSGFKGACWFNRYWNAKEPFSHARFGGYLVTRLDGFTVSEAKGLVTQALAAERQTPRGPFLLDTHHKSGMGDLSAIPARLLKVDRPRHATLMEMPYKDYNADLVVAGSALAKGGFDLVLQQSAGFTGSDKLLAGYCSWGSNDPAYNAKTYRAPALCRRRPRGDRGFHQRAHLFPGQQGPVAHRGPDSRRRGPE